MFFDQAFSDILQICYSKTTDSVRYLWIGKQSTCKSLPITMVIASPILIVSLLLTADISLVNADLSVVTADPASDSVSDVLNPNVCSVTFSYNRGSAYGNDWVGHNFDHLVFDNDNPNYLHSHCFAAELPLNEASADPSFLLCEDVYKSISNAFVSEKAVNLKIPLHYCNSSSNAIKALLLKKKIMMGAHCNLIVIPKLVPDRSCLMNPSSDGDPTAVVIKIGGTVSTLDAAVQHAIQQINRICHTFRDVSGALSDGGLHREKILGSLFAVASRNDSVLSSDVFIPLSRRQADKRLETLKLPMCERVVISNWEHFFSDHLKISKPVIIKKAIDNWKAHSLWTNELLVSKYGSRRVHVKVNPNTDYEGVDRADQWDNFQSFHIPAQVKTKLPYPDLVVSRPAPVDMKFSDFVSLMDRVGNGSLMNISAYLEYSSLLDNFPELQGDVSELKFLNGKLKLNHLNIWLSDGNTLGKLHFDPFDNFLCQIEGSKELLVFEPHDSRRLYEGHIQEAQFSVSPESWKFKRHKLMDTTSMVMSPVDIKDPDYERFPLFAAARPMNCTISAGEVLFLPAFWWHEVQSYPNTTTRRNLAVNFWYEPFLTKEFPCPECKLDVNPFYYSLL